MSKSNKPISFTFASTHDRGHDLKEARAGHTDHLHPRCRAATRYLGRSPATAEDLRKFQLHMAETGTSSVTSNATLTGLKFFFTHTLDRPSTLKLIQRVYEPRKIPEVLSTQEVNRILDAAGRLRNKAALSVAYGAGLRASEVCHLSVTDIDSEREVIRVKDGKGQRDRDAMLSPALLKILRAWYREGQAKRKLLPGGGLCQTALCWARGCTRLPLSVYPSNRHLQLTAR